MGANVIVMEVSGEEDVDFLQAGFLCGGVNAFGVPIVGCAVGGIDEHGLAGRSHDQRGSTAFGVDPVNFQILGRGSGSESAEQQDYE